MDKRYQVFVSSTYTDLLEARTEVMQALLELDCMPAGMELFPAANEEQWEWIKRVIEESDYYVVILAGRYGSVSKQTGVGYTEMEYKYALEVGKPVIGFVHENPAQLPAKFCEQTDEGRAKLQQFRELVEQKLCKHWSSPADLGAKVSRSLTQLIKQFPAVGWARANELNEDSSKELLALRKQVEELQGKLKQVSAEGPPGLDNLAQGNEVYEVGFVADKKEPRKAKNDQIYWAKVGEQAAKISLTWDEIFAHLAPRLIHQSPETSLSYDLNRLIEGRAMPLLEKQFKGFRFDNFRIFTEVFDTIKIQLRALRLIASVGVGYPPTWELTDYGDVYMAKLLAVQRQPRAGRKAHKKTSNALKTP